MASASSSPAILLLLKLAALALFFHGASAATHVVGGNLGWSIPSDTSFYQQWAASQTFAVGDVLVFNFATNSHTVAEVSRNQYDSCTAPSSGIITEGPANITLEQERTYYFICTIGQHCNFGQKLAVNVAGGGGGSSPPPTPANGPSPSTPTTPSAATPPAAPNTPPTSGTGVPPSTPGTGVPPSTLGPGVPPSTPDSGSPVAAVLGVGAAAVALAALLL